ncbi:pilin [Candidatus Parcubacteria bacterium]|nr:pilin [Candidatus Parcubacteria bacterium]
MKKIFPHFLAFILLFMLSITLVHAQDARGGTPSGPDAVGSTPGGTSLPNPFKGGNTLPEFLKKVIDTVVLPIGAVLAVLGFIWSGFKYVMARGNENQIKEATTALLYTSIGTAVLLGSYVIANVIEGTINQF